VKGDEMPLSSIHFLLSYACTYECDHCFLYSSPSAKGTFTVGALDAAFDQIAQCPGITSVCFEGGEPFLYYPLLLYGVKKAKEMGLGVDIVTNCYWAVDGETAVVSLKPFADLGVESITVSEDEFHCGKLPPNHLSGEETMPSFARHAAKELGISDGTITIDEPTVETPASGVHTPGEEIVGGGVRFRGRAVEVLAKDLPGKPAGTYRECPDEDIVDPKRLHLDPYGDLHICQGLIVANINTKSLKDFVAECDPLKHPVLKGLMERGPYRLGVLSGLINSEDEGEYVDACHLCYLARKGMRSKYPNLLGPPGVYGEGWE
jgi:hypothetical protein